MYLRGYVTPKVLYNLSEALQLIFEHLSWKTFAYAKSLVEKSFRIGAIDT